MPSHAPSPHWTKLLYTPKAEWSTTTCNPLSYGATCCKHGSWEEAAGCSGMYKKKLQECAAMLQPVPESPTSVTALPLHTAGKRNGSISEKNAGRGWGSGSADGCVLHDAAAILCTQIKFFVFSFLRQKNTAARHYTWQYANYKFYLPLTRNNFFWASAFYTCTHTKITFLVIFHLHQFF